MLNEEWKDEIENDPYFNKHIVMNDDEWYGTTARLYDKNGLRTHVLDETAYIIRDPGLLKINSDLMIAKIHKDDSLID
jgi:hypothetical protein